MARPENILLDENGPFAAKVESAVYMGQTFQYVLDCEGVSIYVADYGYHTHGIYQPGAAVRFDMVVPSLRLIPEGGINA